MNYREIRSEREYELVVVWKLLDDHISVKKHKILVKNMLKPQMRELTAAIKEVYPYLEKSNYSLYCRYNGSQLYPIRDHITLVTAYTLMDAHEVHQLYMIRKDIGEWNSISPELLTSKSDVDMINKSGHPTRDSTEYRRGRAEHNPDREIDARRSSKKRSVSGGSRKSMSRKSMSRKSKINRKSQTGRKSKTGRKSVAKRGSMKRKSAKPK